MKKELLHPDHDHPDYSEGIAILSDCVLSILMCDDAEDEADGSSSIAIEMLPYDIPTDKKIQREICRDICEAINDYYRESDKILKEVAIGNGDFDEEDPESYDSTSRADASIKDNKLHIWWIY